MDNLTFDDLKVYTEDLKQEVKKEVNQLFELYLNKATKTDICFCGCNNNPIAELIISVDKITKIKRYGVIIYPKRKCYMPIMNCDNAGSKISSSLYNVIQTWHKSIPTPYERQLERTNIYSRELLEKIWSPRNIKLKIDSLIDINDFE